MLADRANFEFMLDLDYIFNWVQPEAGEEGFKFWVAPVTMVFENASDVKIGIDSKQGTIQIDNLLRTALRHSPNGEFVEYAYHFECQEGEVCLDATGYKLFVRAAPSLLTSQSFELQLRNGVSFERGLGFRQ
jgi:hypothetical protein